MSGIKNDNGASVRSPGIDNFAEESISKEPHRIARYSKDNKVQDALQALTPQESEVYRYLRIHGPCELIQSIRDYSAALKIPREEVKKALQGLKNKGKVSLRTVKEDGRSGKLGVTIKEE